jgi:hypothetical protein
MDKFLLPTGNKRIMTPRTGAYAVPVTPKSVMTGELMAASFSFPSPSRRDAYYFGYLLRRSPRLCSLWAPIFAGPRLIVGCMDLNFDSDTANELLQWSLLSTGVVYSGLMGYSTKS